jgi:hypothetical protein
MIVHNVMGDDEHDDGLLDQDGSFKTNWLSRSLGQQRLRSSFMYIMGSLIATLTIDFKQIGFSIIGHW